METSNEEIKQPNQEIEQEEIDLEVEFWKIYSRDLEQLN